MATAINSGLIEWEPAPTGAINDVPSHIGLWTALTGGTFLGGDAIGNTVTALVLGEKLQISALALTLTIPDGADFTPAMALRMVNGMISSSIYISVHEGDPGDTGASAIPLARQEVATGGWTTAP